MRKLYITITILLLALPIMAQTPTPQFIDIPEPDASEPFASLSTWLIPFFEPGITGDEASAKAYSDVKADILTGVMGGGSSTVVSDATLGGTGITGDVLYVQNPYTTTDENKLDGLEQSDWTATSGGAEILNKPTLFSGSYTDLSNQPSLFSGAYSALSGRPTLFSGSYSDLTNRPTIPAAVSRANVYAQVKEIIIGGNNIITADDDSAMTVILNGQAAGASGVTTYLGLSDTSSSYGTTRQVPAVNTNSDGLEWIDVSESTRANIYSHHAIFVPGANMALAKDGNNETITFNVNGIEEFAKTAQMTSAVPATKLAASPANYDLLRYETDAPAWGPKYFTPDSTGDCPTPPHGAVNMAICTKDDGIYYATERIIHATAPTGTWEVVDGDTTTVSTIKTGFYGVVGDIHSGTPTPSFADGSYIFDLSTSHFYAVTRSTIDTSNVYWSQQEDPSDWLGVGSLPELLFRATAIGDWGYDETQHEIEYLSAFTAGTVLQELGEWTSITPIGGYPLAENVVGLEDFIDNDLHNFDSPNESYLSPGNGVTFTAGTPDNPKLSINAVPEYAADWIGDNYIMVGGALSLAVVDADVTNNIDRSLTITNRNPLLPDAGNGNTRLFLAADLDLTGPPTLAWTPPSAAPFSTYYAPLYNRLKDTVLVGGPTITITSDDSAGTLTISGPPAGSGEANPQRITTAEAGSFINATLTDGDTLRSWSQNLFRQSVYGSIRSGGASATTTIRGSVEYATNTEAIASSPASNKVITPANLAHWGTTRITDGNLLTGNASTESRSIAPSRQSVAEMGASIISQTPAVTDAELATNNTASESTSIAPSRQAVAEMGALILSQGGGGGGGGTPAARILLGTRTINDDDTPYTIVFTEGVPRGYLLQIQYGANPMIYAEISSDVILSLTQSAATPTNLNNGINLKVARIGENSISQFGHGGISIWKATSSSTNLTMIWVSASHDVTSNAVMTVYAQSFSGSDGADGMDSTVPGPAGAAGADSTVPGPRGDVGPAGTGTVVTANPSGADGSDLTRIGIDGTNWVIPAGGSGTVVTANPSGSDGSDITRLAIDGTNWVISAGGGGTVVTASASSVSGATEAGSMNVAGTDWNFPSSGGAAGSFDTVSVGTSNVDVTTDQAFVATGIIAPTAADSAWLLVNFGDVSAAPITQDEGAWYLVKTSALLAKVNTVGAQRTTGSLEIRTGVDLNFGGNDFYLAVITGTREILLASNDRTVDSMPFSVEKVVAGPASTVPGPAGVAGADSTVPGPAGVAGADSIVPGPAGSDGADGTIVSANPSGSDGSDLTRIAIGGTNWVIPAGGGGGTTVTASASSVSGATEAGSLNIAGTNWNFPAGSGGRDTFVVNTPSERPDCTSSIAGYQYYVLQSDSEYVCVNIAHTTTASTGSFVVVATRSDLGVETNLPNPSSLTVGIFAYLNTDNVSSGGQEFYEVEQVSANHRSWVQTNATAALADSRSNSSYSITWLGSESTPADALEFTHSISVNRDYFYLDVEDDLFYRLNRTTFVGSGSVVNHYQWLLVGANLGDLAYQDKVKQTQFEDNAILTDALNAGAVTYPKLTTALQQKLNNAVVGFQQEATTLLVRQTSLDTGMATDTVFPLAMLDSNDKLAVAVIPDGYNEAIDEVTATSSGLSFLKVGSTNTTQVIAPSAVRTAAGLSTAAAIRTAAGLGTAAVANTGVASGNVPVLDSNGKLATSTYDAGTGGISQTDADARYVELGGDTMTSTLNVTPDSNAVALFLNATALTTQTPFVFNINATGNQQAMWLRRGTTGQAWLTVDGNIGGGNGNPGFALGIGGTAGRDVLLYRGGDDLLETPDSFTVGGDLTVTGGYGLVAADIPTIPSTKVSGLGDLAILDAVSSGQITDASVSHVDLNSAVTATLVANSEAFDGAVPINNGLRFDRVDDANPLTLSASQLRAAAGVGEAGRLAHGTDSGEVPVLGIGGVLPAGLLGTGVGTTPGSKVLYDDGTFKDEPTGLAFSNEAEWRNTGNAGFVVNRVYHTDIQPPDTATILYIEVVHSETSEFDYRNPAMPVLYSSWSSLGDAPADQAAFVELNDAPNFFSLAITNRTSISTILIGKTSSNRIAIIDRNGANPDENGIKVVWI